VVTKISTATYNFVLLFRATPNTIIMQRIKTVVIAAALLQGVHLFAQTPKKTVEIKKTKETIKIDGLLDEPIWKSSAVATNFVTLRPSPFIPESPENKSEVFFLYNDQGIYIGGYFHEANKDSIASELIGRDGFGNNDFAGIIFDTYQDKLNGFEYFVTPLGEQMDAKVAPNNNGNNEDFSWNAVWKSASKIQKDGWTFEIFLPYAAIRFGNKKVQDWGLNIVRRRQKSGQQLFWQTIDPTVNGFLTQEGTMTGLTNIKAPVRLQLSPYLSTYINRDGGATGTTPKNTTTVNGGMDIKYGLSPAFTLDMTLIPDFGQVQTDNRILNLSPFEQQFAENRTFFTEGTELFNKGNLFYSRRIGRIGASPIHYYDAQGAANSNESVVKNPENVKLLNATKISGRTQKGLGIGVLNAITKPQHAIIENNNTKEQRKYETEPLTNYNVTVLDQTFKHNSSISFVNTNVMRSGNDYDANVSAFLFDFNDKKNKWNVGGNVGFSKIFDQSKKTPMGYNHSLYFGKTSGRFNFSVWQDLTDAKYDKSDLGYFTNNNQMINGIWSAYNWNKPGKWYNNLRLNGFVAHGRLVSPKDILKRKEMMFMGIDYGVNGNAQLKNLWSVGMNINGTPRGNDFYEPRVDGRVFKQKGRIRIGSWWNSNDAKKLSWGGNFGIGTGDVFKQKRLDVGLYGKIRFSSKFSVDHSININQTLNQAGFAGILYNGNNPDTVIFSRRDINNIENVLSFKYSFTNKMGLTLRARHYFSKVEPLQFYQLDKYGDLQTPTTPFTKNVNQNYNFLSVDMVYTWQIAQGSFVNIVWKSIADNFTRAFEKDYFSNLNKTINGDQFTSLSVRVIYFLDYATIKAGRTIK
jgi:hypothetical protein